MNDPKLLFWPVIAQIALTLFLFLRLAWVKQAALAAGEVDLARRALHPDAWPDRVVKVTNAIRNQFEMPVLFYVVIVMLWALKAANLVTLALAWGYVAARYAHAFEHTGSNVVPRRLAIFKLSTVLLVGLWLWTIYALVIS